MKVAVTGCCHGKLEGTYQQVQDLEEENGYKIDLVLVNGDFQAIRNPQDLQCMAVPERYRHMGTFHKYYTGEATAPVLTIVIGGNHEASNYMWELYHGGWLAPNVYYLGGSGCVNFGGLRVAGASGIYKGYNYRAGHHERLPYKKSDIQSVYHTRSYDVLKLRQLSTADVFMSHDWPVDITKHGDEQDLLKRKPHFQDSIKKGQLGSPPMMELLRSLRPLHWFSAHMHCRFEAIVNHESDSMPAPAESETGPDTTQASEQLAPPGQATRFLALDKCLPGRQYMHVIDIEPSVPSASPASAPALTYDREWLAISRALHPYLSTTQKQRALPQPQDMPALIAKSQRWVDENVGEREIADVQKFVMTAPGPENLDSQPKDLPQPPAYSNPQTETFCAMLGIENKIKPPPSAYIRLPSPGAAYTTRLPFCFVTTTFAPRPNPGFDDTDMRNSFAPPSGVTLALEMCQASESCRNELCMVDLPSSGPQHPGIAPSPAGNEPLRLTRWILYRE
ncbi:hypothetical protein FRC12_016132 [Ceratobasidium sp. 428]|nr:hypothetical protein FRC12_016132 [Ceratobasidium sp. 428]